MGRGEIEREQTRIDEVMLMFLGEKKEGNNGQGGRSDRKTKGEIERSVRGGWGRGVTVEGSDRKLNGNMVAGAGVTTVYCSGPFYVGPWQFEMMSEIKLGDTVAGSS